MKCSSMSLLGLAGYWIGSLVHSCGSGDFSYGPSYGTGRSISLLGLVGYWIGSLVHSYGSGGLSNGGLSGCWISSIGYGS